MLDFHIKKNNESRGNHTAARHNYVGGIDHDEFVFWRDRVGYFFQTLLILMLFGLFGCKDREKTDFVFDEFKSQIEKKGMKIDSVDKAGLIYISQDGWKLSISLDNVRRNYERDKDPSHISDLVQTVANNSFDIPGKWTNVKNDIYISLFPNDNDFKDYINRKITDDFNKVYIHVGNNKLTWLTKDHLAKWNITESELDMQANNNADALLKQTPISFDTIANRKIGSIEVNDTYLKGALLFAPTMKEKVKADFGFPFYAVIPVRDFCYIFSEKDYDFFSKRIGKIVVDEYKHSGYPITTEILKFTQKGVEAVGKYPVE